MQKIRNAIFFVMGALVFLAAAGPAWAGGKDLAWSQIPADAMSDAGMARVIVGMSVEHYEALAGASAQFKVITPGEETSARAGARTADAALEAAIAQAADAVLASLPKTGYTVNRTYSAFPFLALSVTPAALDALRADPRVTSIEIDAPVPVPDPVPDDSRAKDGTSLTTPPASPSAKGANLNWGPTKVGADVAWGRGYTGLGWYVAILDTGIRRTHQFFAGKIIKEACYSALANCPGETTSATGVGSAAHYASTYSGYDHGTHCAGIALGKKADGSVAGVAKDANLIAIQVFSKTGSTSIGSYASDQLAGLNYVYSLRNTYSIAAASMSLGSGSYTSPCDSDSRKAAIDILRSVNIATAIATGNNYYCGSISKPACISTAIAVGASTSTDQESSFSNWDPQLQTLFAPGSSIYSSTGDSDTSYASWDGTSMATPHVAGAWAILRQNRPNDSVVDILGRVLAAGTPVATGCSTPTGSKPRLYIPGALQGGSGKGVVNLMLLDVPAAIVSGGGN